MSPNDERLWERSRQYVPNKRVSMLRLLRWRKMRRTKRNRKSLLAYWWAPVAVTLTMAAGIFFAAMGLPEGNLREGESLPEPGLYVVYTTQEMMTRLVRAENVRRIALALNDDEVGISLKAVLPEPPLYRAQTVESPDYYALPVSEKRLSAEGFLPPMAEEVMAYPAQCAVKWLPDAALSASGFKVELPLPGADVRETSARFGVRLNASGHVVDVLRLAPAGRETAWLRQLRMALLKGRGTNAAQGVIRIYWDAEGEE